MTFITIIAVCGFNFFKASFFTRCLTTKYTRVKISSPTTTLTILERISGVKKAMIASIIRTPCLLKNILFFYLSYIIVIFVSYLYIKCGV